MSRNKYPEETVNLILEVSLKLFIEKGYDQTSIQDIIDHLGGLSKGAIYHHFPSKESILIEIYNGFAKEIDHEMRKIMNDDSLNGLQKLTKMYASSMEKPKHMEMFSASPQLLDNPRMLAEQMRSTIYDTVPNYILPVVEEGVKDGSIKTKYPKEFSEMIILISNVWLNPLIYPMKEEEINSKIAFFNEMMNMMGVPLMNLALNERLEKIQEITHRDK